MASSTLVFEIASALTWGLGLIVILAFIIASATVVRRHRPDATPLLLGAMIFELLVSIASYAASLVLPRFLSLSSGTSFGYGGYGGSGYLEAQALSTLVFGVAHAASRTLLLWGIIRLAQPVRSTHS